MIMKRVLLDSNKMNEAKGVLINYRKAVTKKLPEGWKITTLFAPIQYEKTVLLGKKIYIGYLRSRWGYPFSVEIYEKGRKFKLKKLVFTHNPINVPEDNPPLKSMKIIDKQLEKMDRELSNR